MPAMHFFRVRRYLMWLALAAVLLHAVLPMVHGAAMRADSLANICSAGGVLSADAAARIPLSPDSQQKAPKCPLCLAGAQLALGMASGTQLAFDPQGRHEAAPAPLAVAHSVLPAPAFQARAPPVFL